MIRETTKTFAMHLSPESSRGGVDELVVFEHVVLVVDKPFRPDSPVDQVARAPGAAHGIATGVGVVDGDERVGVAPSEKLEDVHGVVRITALGL